MTNYERIKTMTMEEMADVTTERGCKFCDYYWSCEGKGSCGEWAKVFSWLASEADDD